MGHTNPSAWIMIFFHTKVTIFENLMKNLIAAGVLRINIWFSIPVPKIKFDPPPQQKNAKKYIFCLDVEISSKDLILLVLLGKL